MKRRSVSDKLKERRLPAGRERDGSALVEFAIVAPLFFFMVFLFVEFNRYVFAVQAMEEAVRGACRVAIVKDASVKDVDATLEKMLTISGIRTYTRNITPDLATQFQQGDLVTVTVMSRYADISWMPAMNYLQSKIITASCTLPKEG